MARVNDPAAQAQLQKSGYPPLEKKIDLKFNQKPKKNLSKLNPAHNKRFSEEEEDAAGGIGDDELNEVQSYVKMFTDDEGPVKSIFNKDKYLQVSEAGGNLMKTSQSLKNMSTKYNHAVKQIKDYEAEIQNYKQIIDGMTKDMENVKTKQMLNNQEMNLIKEENMHLRTRISEYQMDLMQYKERLLRQDVDKGGQKFSEDVAQKLAEKDAELKKSLDKFSKLKQETDKLRAERDKLIEISNNLRSKLNEVEEHVGQADDEGENLDAQKLRSQNEVAYERIQELESTIASMRQEIEKWKKLDEEKQAIIEKLRQ